MTRREFGMSALATASAVSRIGADGQSAATGELRKIGDVVIYRDSRYYTGPGPSLVAVSDRELLAAFRRSPEFAHGHPEVEMCLTRSHDGGRTWDAEVQVMDFGPLTNPNLTLLRDGSILLASHSAALVRRQTFKRLSANPANRKKLSRYPDVACRANPGADCAYAVELGSYVRRSQDLGLTWTQPYWVSPVGDMKEILPGFPSPVAIRNPVVGLKDGSLVLPVYSEETLETAYLMESWDLGVHWKLRGIIARPLGQIGFNETVLYECRSGKLVTFMRISGGNGNLYVASSRDGGRTWSAPIDSGIWGSPATVVEMGSGRVLLAYGYRRKPFGIRARLLDPECEVLSDAKEIILRDDGGIWDLGYPAAAVLPSGAALVTYYFNERADGGQQRFIAGTFVEEKSTG